MLKEEKNIWLLERVRLDACFLNAMWNTDAGMDDWLKSLLNNCAIRLVIGTDLKALYLMLNRNKILISCLERVLLLVTFVNVSFDYLDGFLHLHW